MMTYFQIVINADNGKTVKIETQGPDDVDFTEMTTTDLPPNGEIQLPEPTRLVAIRIKFVEAVDQTVDYVIKIGIHACFEVVRK
jgi:hypothetical protein